MTDKKPDMAKWVDEGVFYLVSPLDTDNMTEVELTEEQEIFLAWLHSGKVRHVRIEVVLPGRRHIGDQFHHRATAELGERQAGQVG